MAPKEKPDGEVKGPRETPAMLQAFEDYYELGPKRSLQELANEYAKWQGTSREKDAPTFSVDTLGKWSTKFGWQERCSDRVREQNAANWEKIKADVADQRAQDYQRVTEIIEATHKGIKDGSVRMSGHDFTKLLEAKYSLLGEPLADRHEHTGKGGGPIQLEHGVPDDQAADFLANATAVIVEDGGAEEEGVGGSVGTTGEEGS